MQTGMPAPQQIIERPSDYPTSRKYKQTNTPFNSKSPEFCFVEQRDTFSNTGRKTNESIHQMDRL